MPRRADHAGRARTPTRPSRSCSAPARRARRAGDAPGLRVHAAGTHALARGAGQPIVPLERYERMLAALGPRIYRQLVCGLHVHVSMPDPETCLRAFEAIVPWLPTLLALSANSPFAEGEATGRRSERAERLLEMPTGGTPPVLRSWDDWEPRPAGDRRRRHWDAWPRPEYGTLEVRVMDMQTDVRRSAGLRGDRPGARRHGRRDASRRPYDRDLYARRRSRARATAARPGRGRGARRASSPTRRRAPLARLVLAGRPEAERQLEVALAGIAAVPRDVVERTLAFSGVAPDRDDPGQRHPLRAVREPRSRAALGGHEGLEAANANLMGEVTLAWDDDRTDRERARREARKGRVHEKLGLLAAGRVDPLGPALHLVAVGLLASSGRASPRPPTPVSRDSRSAARRSRARGSRLHLAPFRRRRSGATRRRRRSLRYAVTSRRRLQHAPRGRDDDPAAASVAWANSRGSASLVRSSRPSSTTTKPPILSATRPIRFLVASHDVVPLHGPPPRLVAGYARSLRFANRGIGPLGGVVVSLRKHAARVARVSEMTPTEPRRAGSRGAGSRAVRGGSA